METEAYLAPNSAEAIALEAEATAAQVLTESEVVGGLAGFFRGFLCLPGILVFI